MQKAHIQDAHEEYERVQKDVATATEQLQEAKKLKEAVNNFENTLNNAYLSRVPTEHPYELKKNKKTKTKEKVYQVPKKDYLILQERNGLQPHHMRTLVAEILEPVKKFLERMPIFKKLSQQIEELQIKLIAKDCELQQKERQLESSREDVQKLRNYIKANLHKSDAQIDKIINPDRPSRSQQQHDLGDDVLGER